MTLYGFKALKENIKNIDHVDISNHKVNEIDFLKNNGIKYTIRAQSFFNNFKGINHQFVVSYTIKQKNNDLQSFLSKVNLDKKIIFVIVDSIMDPHNFGAILRTCEAFNVDGVIYKKDNQVQITDVVSKTSQGAADRLNLFRVTNLSNAIQILKENKFWIYSSALIDSSTNYKDINYDDHTVLIIGNEERGVSKGVIEASDFVIKIPMLGTSQSLNVSVATGILLAEIALKK